MLHRAAGKSYDLIGQGYVVDHTPHGKIDKTGRAGRRLHHHYTTSAFNSLEVIFSAQGPPIKPWVTV
jgi:hypothetical protein